MIKQVIGIRTHCWGQAEEKLYSTLLKAFPKEHIFVIADEMKGEVLTPNFIQKINWNEAFLERKNLLNYNHFNRGLGWLCGDYFYYAFEEQVKADFYWLIEPDVVFSFSNLNDFFDKTESYQEAALLSDYKQLAEDHYWFKPATLIDTTPYGCLFPLTRLSHKAVEVCYTERKRISEIYKKKQAFSHDNNPVGIHFPNDEVLVATTLVREGLSIKSLNDIFPTSYHCFSYHNVFSLPIDKGFELENQVIHPARSLPFVTEKLSRDIISLLNKENPFHSLFVERNDISFLSAQIGQNVAHYIQEKLTNKISTFYTLTLIKDKVYSELENYIKPTKIWVYEDRVFVIDFVKNNRTFALDFSIENECIRCETFERYGNGDDWQEIFLRNSQFIQRNNRIVLFSAFINDEDLSEKIAMSLKLFYAALDEC